MFRLVRAATKTGSTLPKKIIFSTATLINTFSMLVVTQAPTEVKADSDDGTCFGNKNSDLRYWLTCTPPQDFWGELQACGVFGTSSECGWRFSGNEIKQYGLEPQEFCHSPFGDTNCKLDFFRNIHKPPFDPPKGFEIDKCITDVLANNCQNKFGANGDYEIVSVIVIAGGLVVCSIVAGLAQAWSNFRNYTAPQREEEQSTSFTRLPPDEPDVERQLSSPRPPGRR